MIMDYPTGPNVITKVLIRQREETLEGNQRHGSSMRRTQPNFAGLKMEWGHEPGAVDDF